MAKRDPEDRAPESWTLAAAYLYTLDLDGPALAWEYLRRHPGYRTDWDGRKRALSFDRWGLRRAEDPALDGRHALPLWLSDGDGWLQVRAALRNDAATRHFDLWRVPGRKRLALDGPDLALMADLSAQRMRLLLSGALTDGAPYATAVPLTPQLRGQLHAFQIHAALLEGKPVPVALVRTVTRAALLHLRALQALDAWQAGARQREIAEVLFGAEVADARWTADGELRAQVRHLLARGKGLMDGGYLGLARVRQPPRTAPGGEAMR
jgi:hypothetical protein